MERQKEKSAQRLHIAHTIFRLTWEENFTVCTSESTISIDIKINMYHDDVYKAKVVRHVSINCKKIK